MMNTKRWSKVPDSEQQRKNGVMVDREVFCCVSSEADFILKSQEKDAPFTWDDVENLYPTYEEAKEDGIINEDVTEEDYEPEQKEIFEYWKVSSWLLTRLDELHEPVIKHANIWCRCTSGQAILLDWCITKIQQRSKYAEGG
jgi:hypothetical protein